MNTFIALVGMCGAGKSIIADELVNRRYSFFRFGQITLDIVKERGLEPTEEIEMPIREEMSKKHGMGAFAILNMPKIDNFLKKGNVVGDGLYSWTEYNILKEKYKEKMIVIAVYAPPKLRYKRLAERKLKADDKNLRNRPMTAEQAKNRDFAEIENIEKAGPIAMADYTLLNTTTIPELLKQFNKIMEEIENA
jgi:dephospho-CoA kinase